MKKQTMSIQLHALTKPKLAYYFSSEAVCDVTGAKEVDIAATAEHIRDQRADTMNNKVSVLYSCVLFTSVADSSKCLASLPDYST